MGLKINKITLSYSEELGNVLLWDIAEDKIIHGCKKKLYKFTEKKEVPSGCGGLSTATSFI